MADIFQGSALPDIKETTTKATTAPSYYTDYLSSLAQTGQSELNRSPSQMVAGYDPLQTQGYGALPAAATAYQPGLATATGTAAGAAGAMTPQGIQQFMNPYTTNVVDEMARLQQQNIQRNVMPAMKGAFVGSGGLGGQRYANAAGQTLADMQSNLLGQQGSALQKGYQDALQAAYNQGNLLNTTARTQGDLAAQEQSLGLTGVGALTKAGAERQAYEQSLLDAQLKNATNVAALMRGYTVPTSTTDTYVGPKASAYSTSPLAQVAGLGTLLGSAFNTTTNPNGSTTSGWGNTLAGLISGGLGGVKDWLNTLGSNNNVASDTLYAKDGGLAAIDRLEKGE